MEGLFGMSLEDISNKLNAFEGEIPPWAALLMESMQSLIKELKCVKDIANRVTELENLQAVSKNVTSVLQRENSRLVNVVKELELKIDDQEQRSRNYCLLLHGCPEGNEENTTDIALNIFNNEIGLHDVQKNDISRSHRIGPKTTQRRNTRSNNSESRPRPIIVRFSNWYSRDRVFKNKKNLKGMKISLSESLTKLRYQLLRKAEEKYGRVKVWSNEGHIMTKENEQYISITHDDL